jgi:hypothetical protein
MRGRQDVTQFERRPLCRRPQGPATNNTITVLSMLISFSFSIRLPADVPICSMACEPRLVQREGRAEIALAVRAEPAPGVDHAGGSRSRRANLATVLPGIRPSEMSPAASAWRSRASWPVDEQVPPPLETTRISSSSD